MYQYFVVQGSGVDRVKKKLCLLLAVIFLFVFSVPVMAYDKDHASSVLTVIKDTVKDSNDLLDCVKGIIQWQIESSKQEILKYREAVKNGETYEAPPEQQDETLAKADELDGSIEQLQTLKEEVDGLEPVGVEQVDQTIDAAKVYFAWLNTAFSDLKQMFDFSFANDEAMKPLNTDEEPSGDDLADIEALYYVIQQVMEDMKALDCPEYLQATYNKYIEQLEIVNTILDSTYAAIERDGYAKDLFCFSAAGTHGNPDHEI